MENNAQLTSYLVESLNGIQTVKAFNGERKVHTETEIKFIKLLRSIFNLGSTGNMQEALKSFVENVGGIVIIWVGAYAAIKGNMTIEQYGIRSSMSRQGCPYDNSCAESFFATIKKGCIYRRKYVTLEEVRNDVFEYVELFYNRKRMHAFLGYLSPVEYRLKYDGLKTALFIIFLSPISVQKYYRFFDAVQKLLRFI